MKTLLSLFLLGLLSLYPISAAAQQPGASENYPTRSVKSYRAPPGRKCKRSHRAPPRAKALGRNGRPVLC